MRSDFPLHLMVKLTNAAHFCFALLRIFTNFGNCDIIFMPISDENAQAVAEVPETVQGKNCGGQTMPNEGGFIYVLTNPSFPEYVKIGYADNVDARVAQLNRSECTPFAFRKYATLHVASRLADKQVHKLIDTFKPELHAKEEVNGKLRVREFFAMSAAEAVELLAMIGSIYGETPQIYASSKDEQKENKMAADAAIATERRSPFSFYKCGITDGAKIVYVGDPSVVCYVAGEREISYNGKTTSLSALAKKLLKKAVACKERCIFHMTAKFCRL